MKMMGDWTSKLEQGVVYSTPNTKKKNKKETPMRAVSRRFLGVVGLQNAPKGTTTYGLIAIHPVL